MKKYVKPLMESEAFVANEYIGACWYMDCACTDPGIIVGGPSFKENELDKLTASLGIYELNNTQIFVGNMGPSNTCPNASTDSHTTTESMNEINKWIRLWNSLPILGWFWPIDYLESELKEHHHVSFTLKSAGEGPNAS